MWGSNNGSSVYHDTRITTDWSLETQNGQRSLGHNLCKAWIYALMVKVNMHCCMYELKCQDDANVRTHLEMLMWMQEQLSGMEASLLDDEFITITLISLPKSYWPLINMILLSATLAEVKIKPDTVTQSLFDKFERLKIEEWQLKSTKNTLLATKGQGKGWCTGNSSTGKKTDIECWKCGKKGHVKEDCHQK